MKNEKQQLQAMQRRASNLASMPTPTGLSKGQRRRQNARKALPKGLPVPSNTQSQAAIHTFPVYKDEFIANVNGSVGFESTGYYVNPGLNATFPWCAPIAGQFEKYTFRSLEFYYKRLVSQFADNGRTGRVILSFDYDAADALPGTKQQAEDQMTKVDGLPSQEAPISLFVNCAELQKQDSKYIRSGPPPANTDIKTYDGGLLAVSTDGCVDNTVIGELRVRYLVDLQVPVLENTVAAPTNFHLENMSASWSPASGVDAPVPFDETAVGFDPYGYGDSSQVISPALTSIVLPVGNYSIRADYQTAGTVIIFQSLGFSINGGGTIYESTLQCASGLLDSSVHSEIAVSSNGTTTLTVMQNVVYTTLTAAVVRLFIQSI